MSQGRLQQMVAVVTGAANGIGEAIARSFVREGASVAIADIDVEAAEQVAGTLLALQASADVQAVGVDVTRADSVGAMIDSVMARWGRVDVLVNAAGGFSRLAPITEVSDDDWSRAIAVNFTSVFLCSRAVLAPMKAQGGGRIINIASQAGVTPNPHAPSYVPYGAAKAGVIGFTRLLAREVGVHGITVNAISPGTTATARVKKARGEDSLRDIAARNPLGSLVEPEDSAEAAVYLASAAARRVTGINLNVNAGSVML